MATFVDLYSTQLDIELASEDTTELFTTARRKKAVQDAELAFVRLTGCTKRYGSLSIVDETQEYDLEAALTDYIRMAGAPSIKIVESGVDDRYIQGDDLVRADPEELDVEESGWRATSSGTPTRWYEKQNGGTVNLGFHPKPNVATGETWTVIVPYIATPTAMSAGTDVPFTIATNAVLRLSPYHQALVHYAASVLEPLRKNYSGAQRQMQLFAAYVSQYLQQERKDGSDQIRLKRDYYARSSTRPHDWRTWP
jgi:hypothetical protein